MNWITSLQCSTSSTMVRRRSLCACSVAQFASIPTGNSVVLLDQESSTPISRVARNDGTLHITMDPHRVSRSARRQIGVYPMLTSVYVSSANHHRLSSKHQAEARLSGRLGDVSPRMCLHLLPPKTTQTRLVDLGVLSLCQLGCKNERIADTARNDSDGGRAKRRRRKRGRRDNNVNTLENRPNPSVGRQLGAG